jgi:tetratricopeptide (TPR) repeat protein
VSRRTDKRRTIIPLAIGITLLGGALMSVYLSRDGTEPVETATVANSGAHEFLGDAQARHAHQSFQQGVAMLQAGEFDHAITAMHEVLAIYPALPEAHVNMGYALLGAGEPGAAADFFNTATDLRPSLHNAYYGLALAERENGNDRAALAAMQAYTHLAAEDERHLPQAQEIIWELQAKTREEGKTP